MYKVMAHGRVGVTEINDDDHELWQEIEDDLDQESEDDDDMRSGDYIGDDGQTYIVPANALHPIVTALNRLTLDEQDTDPCERDSLLLLDTELQSYESDDGSVISETMDSDGDAVDGVDNVCDSDNSWSKTDDFQMEVNDSDDDEGTHSTCSSTVSTNSGRGRGRGGRGRGRGGRGRGRGGRGRGRGGRGRGCGGRGRGHGGRGRGHGGQGKGRRGGKQDSDCWKWSDTKPPSSSTRITYDGYPTPRGDIQDCESILDCFMSFISLDLIDLFVEQTNIYAAQQRSQSSSSSPWSDVTREEIMAFLALNIGMGIVSLPSMPDYWSTEPILSHPWFASVMPRNRFRQILRYFHIVDNSKAVDRSSPSYDKLWKVRPLVDALNKASSENFTLGRNVSVDESMIGTKARISFLQYLPAKPTKWGVKVWVLSDSHTGYIYKFKIYTGKDEEYGTENGLAYNVVMELMSDLTGVGHYLYTDNFYSSPKLFVDLAEKGIYASGTVRSNRRNFPKELAPVKGEKMNRGDMKVRYYNDLTAVHWFDRRDVLVISTIHSGDVVQVQRRSGHSVLSVTCPTIVSDYNANMGGVDAADQHMVYYACGRKTMKFWRRITWRLLDQAILNSHIIYNSLQYEKGELKILQKKFRIELAYQLASLLVGARNTGQGRTPRNPSLNRLKGKHFCTKRQPRKRCIVCSNKKSPSGKCKDTKTSGFCEKCNVFLCIGRCFKRYHTLVKY